MMSMFSLKKLSLAVVFPALLGLVPDQIKKRKNWDNFLPKGRPRGRKIINLLVTAREIHNQKLVMSSFVEDCQLLG
jgi:hypothetical protein